MEVTIIITKNGLPLSDITGLVIDGDGSWPEIAGTSNENGELSLPVSEPGSYTVRLFVNSEQLEVKLKAGKSKTIDL